MFEKSGEGGEGMRGDRLVAMANSRQKESLANGKSGEDHSLASGSMGGGSVLIAT